MFPEVMCVADYDGNNYESWKNGTVFDVLGTSIRLTSIFVSGSGVYYILAYNNNSSVMYWKNGILTYFTGGVTSYGYGSSIFVTSN